MLLLISMCVRVCVAASLTLTHYFICIFFFCCRGGCCQQRFNGKRFTKSFSLSRIVLIAYCVWSIIHEVNVLWSTTKNASFRIPNQMLFSFCFIRWNFSHSFSIETTAKKPVCTPVTVSKFFVCSFRFVLLPVIGRLVKFFRDCKHYLPRLPNNFMHFHR